MNLRLLDKRIAEHLKHPVFLAISEIADAENLEVYTVGGYVRDILLERKSKDIDIVVVGNGIDLAQKTAKKIGGSEVSVFKNFGTAMFKFDDTEIEFVGARKESYSKDSRNPSVENGSLDDDQKRRDFTINALAISLNKSSFGKLIDPFNGIEDLNNRIIRTPLDPDITFSDDPLRMLRAIRFASQLYFEIHPESLKSISDQKSRIKIISAERIADELNKILLSAKPSIGLSLLSKTGLMELIFPEMERLKGVEINNEKGHKDNFLHTLKVVDNISMSSNDLWLRWAALLHDIGKPATKRFDKKAGWTFHGHEVVGAKMVHRIFNRFRLPLNEKMKFVEKLVFLHLRPIVLSEDSVTDSAIRRLLFEAGEDIEALMMLCQADITSKNAQKVERFHKNFELVKLKLIEIEEKDSLRNWQPPISGEIIMQTFGLNPCKEVGMIKDAIREAILDGLLPNEFDTAFQFMVKKGQQLGFEIQNDNK